MNFKKTIAKSLVVAMALGMVPVANLQTAKAAAPTDIKLTATGLVTSTNAKYWGVAKLVNKAGNDTILINSKHYKVSNIQEYPEGGIDAYTAFKGKAGIIVTGTTAIPNSTDWTKLDLNAAEKTFKVQYVADKKKVKGLTAEAANAKGGDYGWLVGTKVVNKVTTEVALDQNVEGKLNDGNWQSINDLLGADNEAVNKKLKMATQNGSTYTFRIKGTEGSFASKESKVKITPQAKAPSVKVDTTKETVTIKKGMDWQVVEIGNTAVAPDATKWTAAGVNTKSMAITDLKVAGTTNGLTANKKYALFVRTTATDKKIASKYSMLTLNARPDAMKFDGDKIENEGADIKTADGNKTLGSIKSALIYDLSKGAVLTNASTDDWEYAISKDVPTKWNTLKAPKDAKKPSVAKLKYSTAEKPNTFGWADAKLYLRVAGTKQTKDGVATLAGVIVNKEIKLKNTAQELTFESSTADNATENTHALGTLNPKYKIATGTAAVITIKAKIAPVVKPEVAPKIKVTAGPKVKVKAGKVDKDGKFDITIDISKSLFKTPESITDVKVSLKFEGVDKEFTLGLAKKD